MNTFQKYIAYVVQIRLKVGCHSFCLEKIFFHICVKNTTYITAVIHKSAQHFNGMYTSCIIHRWLFYFNAISLHTENTPPHTHKYHLIYIILKRAHSFRSKYPIGLPNCRSKIFSKCKHIDKFLCQM